MANTRLDDLRMVDPVLTTIAQGYSNESLIYDKLFPEVQVSKLKGKIPFFGRDAFILRDTHRAVRSESNRIAPSDLSLIEFETQERDVETAIDYIEEEESPDLYSYEQRITKELTDIISLDKERTAADLALDPANYHSDLKLEVSAGDAFDDTLNNNDPIPIIRDCIHTLKKRIGKMPNTMILGSSTYHALVNNEAVSSYIQYVGLNKVDVDIIRQLTEIKNVYVGNAVHTEDGLALKDIWNDSIVIAYVDKSKNKSEYNPSFGYTFQRKGMPEIDSYYENGGKIKVIRATDNYGVKITAQEAAFLIYNTNQA
jgi:hypothetical protein